MFIDVGDVVLYMYIQTVSTQCMSGLPYVNCITLLSVNPAQCGCGVFHDLRLSSFCSTHV